MKPEHRIGDDDIDITEPKIVIKIPFRLYDEYGNITERLTFTREFDYVKEVLLKKCDPAQDAKEAAQVLLNHALT